MSREKPESEGVLGLQEFFSKLDGIDSFVAVEEGFPIAYHGLSGEEADAMAALSVDIYTASSTTRGNILGREKASREIIVVLENDRVIDVAKVRDIILAARGSRKPAEESIQVATSYLENKKVSCPYCNRDLTLETYKCSKCGKVFPYRSNTCPHCGTPALVKKCPECGKPTTGDGRKVELAKPPEAKSLAALEGIVGAAIAGIIALLATGSPIVVGVAGIIGGAGLAYATYKSVKPEYRVVD